MSSKPRDAFEIGELLPVLPLRDLVVFPHMIAPILVGRPASIAALQQAMAGERLLFVTAQRSPDATEPQEDELHTIGTVARAVQLLRLPDGTMKVLVEGLVRARLDRLSKSEGVPQAHIQVLDDSKPNSPEIEALQRSVAVQFSEYVRLNKRIPDEVLISVVGIEDASSLSDTIAAHVIGKPVIKQQLLEKIDLEQRFHTLGKLLGEELEILNLERRIEGEIRSQVKRSQKELYLNEQLKAIRRELGHDDTESREMEQLATAIEEARLSTEAREVAERELDRLSKMSPLSPEATVVRTYIETLCALPWNRTSRGRLELPKVAQKLNSDHYGLEKVKDRILEFLAVIKLTRSFRSPILCFVGPPGVGKTSLGRSIAEAIGRKFVRVSLGGVRDEAEIRGHRRTYVGAMPGRVIQALRKCGSQNPVFLLDEIDKLGQDFRGDPASALLEALDPEQNSTFSDHYLDVGFDLSKVFFITTANVLHTIPPALRDRMEVIQIPGYLDHEKKAIARHFLLPRQMRSSGVESLDLTDEALDTLVHGYTREAGVRNLERELGRLCRKVARKITEQPKDKRGKTTTRIDVGDLQAYLSAPPFHGQEVPACEEVGVATGLAWTAAGGEIIPVEVTMMGGTGQLILTGQLGDVMKESARAALSYVRSVSKQLGVRRDLFGRTDLHVHVPQGAIPKDGPSAGLAIATAMASLVTGKPVDRRLAMTGEITLRGHALAVGGLNEKAVAAVRAGVRKMLVPAANQNDLQELPAEVRESLDIVPVSNMTQVLQIAFGVQLDKKPQTRRKPTTPAYAP